MRCARAPPPTGAPSPRTRCWRRLWTWARRSPALATARSLSAAARRGRCWRPTTRRCYQVGLSNFILACSCSARGWSHCIAVGRSWSYMGALRATSSVHRIAATYVVLLFVSISPPPEYLRHLGGVLAPGACQGLSADAEVSGGQGAAWGSGGEYTVWGHTAAGGAPGLHSLDTRTHTNKTTPRLSCALSAACCRRAARRTA